LGWRYANDQTDIVVDNDGLGPALIREVVFTIDGQHQRDAISGVRQISGNSRAEITLMRSRAAS
jgi:hypothetical protein